MKLKLLFYFMHNVICALTYSSKATSNEAPARLYDYQSIQASVRLDAGNLFARSC